MSENNVWGIKGATISDKSAIEDYGLTHIAAIRP